MNTFIFGIGCSGTTMMYSLLQEIYTDVFQQKYISRYEPYIWDRDKFNRPYDEAARYFGKTSSLSLEGMYYHKLTPVFVYEKIEPSLLESQFYRWFSANSPDTHAIPLLVKFIHGNGRMPIFRRLNPKAKFILILRNPVDTINCSKYKFSFFGEDFFPSDYPRFCRQLAERNMLLIDPESASWAERQAEYCYQMNSAALDFARSDRNTLVLEYDRFCRNKDVSVKEICEFLEVSWRQSFSERIESRTGPTTAGATLSQSEFDEIKPFLNKYDKLCGQFNIRLVRDTTDIIDSYHDLSRNRDYDLEYIESTTNQLRKVIRRQENELARLRKSVEQEGV